MLIEEGYNLEKVLSTVKHEIARAAKDKRHPFRYAVLGTPGEALAMRYVVLRQVKENFDLVIYTDSRTRKVKQIERQPEVQVLLYHPSKKAQVIVTGKAQIHNQNETSKLHWQNVQGEGQKAYTSLRTPGVSIEDPSLAYEWNKNPGSENFAVIEVEPTTIEVLQLRGLEHLRAVFEKEHGWNGAWLVP